MGEGPGVPCNAMIFLALSLAVLAPQERSLEDLVQALGADSPAERDEATRALVKRGPAATGALRKAAAGGDVEVASRAREVLLAIRAARFSSLRVERGFTLQAGLGRADHFRVTPDGKHAVGHDLEHVRVWTVPDGRVVSEWRAHPSGARDLALSPDGTRLLTWSYDGMALWEMPSGKPVRRYDGLLHVPRSFAVSPDGKHVAWATSESVDWLETATGRVAWSCGRGRGNLRTPVAVALSPAGDRVASVGANGTQVEVRDTRTGALALSFRAPSTGFHSRIAFTPDGASVVVSNKDQDQAWRFSATTGAKEAEGSEDDFHVMAGGTARFKVVHPLDEKPHGGRVLIRPPKKPFADSPEQWAPTADEKHVLVRTLNGRRVLVFEAATGKPVREIGEEVSSFAVGSEGVLVGTRKGAAVLYDLEGKELRRVAGGEGTVRRVAFAGPGRALWVDGAHVLRCSELEGGKELWRREYFPLGWSCDAFLPDGLHAVGDLAEPGTGRSHLVRWNLATGREVTRYARYEGYLAGVAASPDGALVAASTRDGPLAVWETVSRKKLWEWKPGKNARWLRFSPDGTSLYSGDDEGRVVRRASATGEIERVYVENGKSVAEGALSENGNRLATLSRGIELRLFDVATGASLHSWKEAGWGGVAFLEGGAKLISGSPVTVADAATGAICRARPGRAAGRSAVRGRTVRGGGPRVGPARVGDAGAGADVRRCARAGRGERRLLHRVRRPAPVVPAGRGPPGRAPRGASRRLRRRSRTAVHGGRDGRPGPRLSHLRAEAGGGRRRGRGRPGSPRLAKPFREDRRGARPPLAVDPATHGPGLPAQPPGGVGRRSGGGAPDGRRGAPRRDHRPRARAARRRAAPGDAIGPLRCGRPRGGGDGERLGRAPGAARLGRPRGLEVRRRLLRRERPTIDGGLVDPALE